MAATAVNAPRYVEPAALGYAQARWRLEPGAGLRFDEAYRLAHLPLLAPDHPAVIRSLPGRAYVMGRCEQARYSLVVPVDAAKLAAAPTFTRFERELRALPLADKIDWSLLPRRAPLLHITLAGGLEHAQLARHSDAVQRRHAEHGPLRFRLGEPFIGDRNHGRIYFAAYPERVDGDDVFARLQDAVGARRSGMYLLGYYNLLDELDATEARALFELLERWQSATLAELTASSLQVIATHDDLALSCEVVSRC
ncbi:MAG: hypothetical protein ABW217_08735 [Polyangiaceae bacterium]